MAGEIRAALQTRMDRAFEILREDGETWYVVRLSPYRTLKNVIEGVVITFSDITATKREKMMAERRAALQAGLADLGTFALGQPDLQAVFDRAIDVLCAGTDTELGTVVELTEDGKGLLVRAGRGWREGTLGTTIVAGKDSQVGYALLSDGPVTVEDLAKEDRFTGETLLREHGVVSGMSVIIPGVDRPYGVLSAHATKRRTFSANEVNYLQTVANILSDAVRRRADRDSLAVALQRTEAALKVRDEFLSTAAHELKTPLTGLRLASQTLSRSIDKAGRFDEARLSKALKAIDGQSTKLARLVSSLLDISRIHGGRLTLDRTETDLVRLVGEVAESVRPTQPGHRIVIDGAKRLAAFVDPLRFEQVVLNLLDNAMKYTPREQEIRVTVAMDDEEKSARISVRDHGKGVPPESRGHLFERFYRAHDKGYQSGMGIGLYISRNIVEAHGGRLWAEFPADGGSCFVISLPAVNGVADAADQGPS